MQPFKSIKFVRQDRLIVLLSKYKFVIVIEFILRKLSGGLKKKKKRLSLSLGNIPANGELLL